MFSGKKFIPKEQEKTSINDDDLTGKIDTEWDEILATASEEELVDLAGEYVPVLIVLSKVDFLA